ncbi:MAG: M36 family metallopeptidase [Kangiellaceae bacterium]|jgi:hypothetical protein|nr:M36 family metallopeptidase [Kangiellaceae bacterium]
MNRKFNLVAFAVSSALAASVVSAVTPVSTDKFEFRNFVKQGYKASPADKSLAQQLLEIKSTKQQRSALGALNQFDKQMGVETFSWHDDFISQERLPNLRYDQQSLAAAAGSLLTSQTGVHGLTNDSVNNAELLYVSNTGKGPIIAKYQQTIDGIEVFGRQVNLLMNQQQNLVATSGYFSEVKNDIAAKNMTFGLSAAEAMSIAANSIGGTTTVEDFAAMKTASKYTSFSAKSADSDLTISDSSRTKRVFFPVGEELIPAYYVEVVGSVTNTTQAIGYSFIVSAVDGEVMFRKNLTEHSDYTYRVIADRSDLTPLDGPFGNGLTPSPLVEPGVAEEVAVSQNVITTSTGPISTRDPWLNPGATTTAGNNVFSYADLTAPDGYQPTGDIVPEANGSIFDYSYDLLAPDSTASATSAAVNLFYTNNYLHDWFYDNGFDERSGNAQMDNYGRGGEGGDRLAVEAQDNSGLNNANMLTPADGNSPRMQMYLFGASEFEFTIGGVTPSSIGLAAFGPQEFDVEGEVVQLTDPAGAAGPGCDGAANAAELDGKIALIDRGGCAFVDKVNSAQAAGAIAVIIANNDQALPDDVINLGGDDAGIAIPSIMVSYNDGVAIKTELGAGTVNATLTRVISLRDGTLDNGIVAHEWSHYMTNRLVGNAAGLGNSQGRGMGEGWSDFLALLITAKESDAALPGNDQFQGVYPVAGFATADNYFGIRRYPYSTDPNVNAVTFRHIENGTPLPTVHPVLFGQDGSNNVQVHATGSVWASMLWDAYTGLINRGDLSFAEAQDRMKTYLVGGLKMTPVFPTFTEARDGILAAAAATDMADYDTILAAFTGRGLGLNAVAPDRFDTQHSGVIEDFESAARTSFRVVGSDIKGDVVTPTLASCDNDGILDATESAMLTFTLKNTGNQAMTATATVSTTADVTYPDGNTLTFEFSGTFGEEVTASIPVTVNSAAPGQVFTFNAAFDDQGGSIIVPADTSVAIQGAFDLAKAAPFDTFSSPLAVAADWTITSSNNNVSMFELDGGGFNQFFGLGQMMNGEASRSSGSFSLESPSVDVSETGDFGFSFFHYTQFPSDLTGQDPATWKLFDGGVVEVKVEGGSWTDINEFIVDEDGEFINLIQYDLVVESTNPVLGGRPAFGVPNFGLPSANQVISIPEGSIVASNEESINGQSLQIRFRIGTDETYGDLGWLIDNVQFTNIDNLPFSALFVDDNVCGNSAPFVADFEDIEISEKATDGSQNSVTLTATASDSEGDTLTYSWAQTAGTAATITGADSNAINVDIPVLSNDEQLEFQVTVNDGTNSVTKTAVVFVNEVNDLPTISISGDSTVFAGDEGTLSVAVTDADDTEFTYNWREVSGAGIAAGLGTSSSSLTFKAPNGVSSLTFEVTVSDGKSIATSQTTVAVAERNTGGSLGWSALSLLALLGLRRRKQK